MKTSGGTLKSLVSAAVGGLVVAVLAFGAISAGWVGKTETNTRTIAAATPVSEESDQGLVNEIYERDGKGVGFITAAGVSSESSELDPFGGSQQGSATGSGFLIDKEGHMVTNNHVVAGSDDITVTLGESDETYEAELVGADESTDLALLKVDAPTDVMQPLAIGSSEDMEVGDPVVAIGNPFGLDRTVTTGIISALQREIQSTNGYSISNVLQTDASINPGNSGGPLINSDGEVIGVNSQIATGGSGNGSVGIGFAVPSDTVTSVVEQIKETGEVKHAFLGVSGATISPDLSEALNLDVDGVLVQEVTEGGPSDEAGLKGGDTAVSVQGQQVMSGGDVITAVDGEEVTSMEEVIAIVNESEVGDPLELTIERDGETQEITVELGERPDDASSSGEAPAEEQLPPGFGQ